MKTLLRLLLLFFIVSVKLWASGSSVSWYSVGVDKKVTINVELFLSSTCSHCHKADAFFNGIADNHSELHIQRNIINEDKNALLRFNQLLSEQNMDDFAVPSIYFCNSRWLGFASAETTGKDLLHAINYCKQQIEKNGALTQATVDTLRHWANANKFDSGMIGQPSALSYIVTIALTDAFAPCAFFCFAGFLAFLWVQEDRKKQIIAACLFLFSVGIGHYFQQVYTNGFYHLLPWLRLPALLLGLLAIYFVVQHYKKQSNNRLYFCLAFLMGLMTIIYQQTCVMNWSYIFEQWLNNQHISSAQAALYQALYQVLYVLPLMLTLIIYLALLKMKRFAALRPRLVTTGLLLILAIALCFIAYPAILSYLTVSLVTVLILIICSRFLNWT